MKSISIPVTLCYNQFYWTVSKTFASTNAHLIALLCHFGLLWSRNLRLEFCNSDESLNYKLSILLVIFSHRSRVGAREAGQWACPGFVSVGCGSTKPKVLVNDVHIWSERQKTEEDPSAKCIQVLPEPSNKNKFYWVYQSHLLLLGSALFNCLCSGLAQWSSTSWRSYQAKRVFKIDGRQCSAKLPSELRTWSMTASSPFWSDLFNDLSCEHHKQKCLQ